MLKRLFLTRNCLKLVYTRTGGTSEIDSPPPPSPSSPRSVLWRLRMRLIFLPGCVYSQRPGHRPLIRHGEKVCFGGRFFFGRTLCALCDASFAHLAIHFVRIWNRCFFAKTHTGALLGVLTVEVSKNSLSQPGRSARQFIRTRYTIYASEMKSISARENFIFHGWNSQLFLPFDPFRSHFSRSVHPVDMRSLPSR